MNISPHSPRVQALLLGALWLLLALLVVPLWDLTYWDFGDGNYLYVGQRIRDGLVPYRDILAPQPPLHLLMSALSQAAGDMLAGSPLIGARAYCLLVRVLGSLMVYLCAWQIFRCMLRAFVAAAVYLALPIGFWWSLCLQSENLEIVLLLLAFWQIMRLERRGAIIAGVASGLAMHCNMTAVPYFLCNALFLGVRRPRLFAWYAPVALGTWGAGAAATYAWVGAAYFDNVVLNQVGSFPREEVLGHSPWIYFRDKIAREGAKILVLEGALIAAAIAAIAMNWRVALRTLDRKSDEYRRHEYAAWYSIGMLLSVGFVMKGGTVNYIFVLGEPAVAIFAADTIVRLARLAMQAIHRLRIGSSSPGLDVLRGVSGGLALLVLLGWWPAWKNVSYTLRGVQSELPEEYVHDLLAIVEEHTRPGDPILAPPFYAWATGRTVAGELAENYLWQIKWINDMVDGEEEGEGALKMREIALFLRERRVPLLLLDLNQTGRVPAIKAAVELHYEPLDPPTYRTRNTTLGLYVPRAPER